SCFATSRPPPTSTLFPYTTLFRSRFETDFFRERLFDLAAADLGIDRVEFRRRNLVSKEEMPYPLPTIEPTGAKSECDSGNYRYRDRKSTRLNSSHRTISYAVFCLK